MGYLIDRVDEPALLVAGAVHPELKDVDRAGQILRNTYDYWAGHTDVRNACVGTLQTTVCDEQHPNAIRHARLVLRRTAVEAASVGMPVSFVDDFPYPTTQADLLETLQVAIEAMELMCIVRECNEGECTDEGAGCD